MSGSTANDLTLRRFPALLALLALVGGAPGCRGCGPADDEEQIRRLIHRAAEYAEGHETRKILGLATDTFTAMPGNHGRSETADVLNYAFMRYGELKIAYAEPDIVVAPNGETATAEVPFVVIGQGGPLPDLGDLVDDWEAWIEEASRGTDPWVIDLDLWKEKGEWKVDRARIEGVRGLDSL